MENNISPEIMMQEHIDKETHQNSDDIRRIIITCLCSFGMIIFSGLCYWIGTVSGKVDSLQVQQAALKATIEANQAASETQNKAIDRDHEAFSAWLHRIEQKIDTLSEKVYSIH